MTAFYTDESLLGGRHLTQQYSQLLSRLRSHCLQTYEHSVRTARLSSLLAKDMGIDEAKAYCGGLLHDIGKIKITTELLHSSESFCKQKMETVKNHVKFGQMLCLDLEVEVAECIAYHHERYDGLGYFAGLSGTNIPIHARIVTVCDAFDAMTSRRLYRPNLTYQEALEKILNDRAAQFCPDCVDAFVGIVTKGDFVV